MGLVSLVAIVIGGSTFVVLSLAFDGAFPAEPSLQASSAKLPKS